MIELLRIKKIEIQKEIETQNFKYVRMNLTAIGKKNIAEFFTKGDERTLVAKKNIAASFIIKSVSIVISLTLVPLTINYVNPTQYGIWLTLSSIVAWFSFFDIGFGNGLRNKFAEAKATGELKKARIYISTTYAVLIIIFTTVWLIFGMTNFFLDWSKILNAPIEMAKELSQLALVVISFFCLQIILKTINTILIADQKPAKSALFDMLGQLLAVIIITVLTQITKDGKLIYLALALGFSPLFVIFISSVYFFKTDYKEYLPSISMVNFKYAKDIMSLGTKFFLIQISAIIIFQTTNIVITQILGPEEVTTYNIAYKYFFIVSMAFSIILTPFWSAFTEAKAKNDYKWMKTSISNLKKIWNYSIPTVCIMLLLSELFYRIWLGNKVIIPMKISIAMAIYVLLYTRFNLFIYLINGMGKIKLQLYINVLFCILYIPLAITMCKLYRIEGIIYGNIIISITHAVVSQIQISKLLNKNARGIWNL